MQVQPDLAVCGFPLDELELELDNGVVACGPAPSKAAQRVQEPLVPGRGLQLC